MKSMLNRGQGAMEYLMTYGWAILVVMVVGIVMWQLGIFNIGGITATTSTGFPRIKPQLALMKVDHTTGRFEGTFTNGAGGPINVDSLSATSGATACTSPELPSSSVSMGRNFQLNITCGSIAGKSRGDPYDIEFTIVYNLTVGGSETIVHTEFGTLRGPLE